MGRNSRIQQSLYVRFFSLLSSFVKVDPFLLYISSSQASHSWCKTEANWQISREILTILEEGNRQTQSQICKFGDDDGPESIESIAQFLAGFISYFHLLPHDQNFISHVFQRIKSYEKTQKTIIALKPLDLKIYGMLELAEIEDVRNFAGHLRGLYVSLIRLRYGELGLMTFRLKMISVVGVWLLVRRR